MSLESLRRDYPNGEYRIETPTAVVAVVATEGFVRRSLAPYGYRFVGASLDYIKNQGLKVDRINMGVSNVEND